MHLIIVEKPGFSAARDLSELASGSVNSRTGFYYCNT
jgi:hypothetical protein